MNLIDKTTGWLAFNEQNYLRTRLSLSLKKQKLKAQTITA